MPNLKNSIQLGDARIDFETRSRVDIKVVGTVNYARHPSTIVLTACLHWRGKKYLFNPASNRKEFKKVIQALHDSGDTISAYNWAFEYNIFKYVCQRLYEWPVFKPKRFVCTMAKALRYGLPGKLEEDAAYLKVVPKDAEGHRIMLRLTKPRKPLKAERPDGLYFDQTPEKHHRNQLYCMRDVETESGVYDKTPPLSKRETNIFRLDQRMGLHGVEVDLELCHGVLQAFESYKADLVKQIPKKAWRHFDSITQREKVKDYINGLDKHFYTENMQADNLHKLLRTCTNKKIKNVLNAYVEAQGTTVAKYAKCLDHQNDGRLYFNLQYCGASNTGRWAGRGVQLHNMFRPVVKYDPDAIEVLKSGDYEAIKEYAGSIKLAVGPRRGKKPSVSEVIKSYTRSMLVADNGCLMSVNDYAAIEARLVFWYSGCEKGLKLYRDKKDAYKALASVIYDMKVKKIDDGSEERFVGKQGILGLGYGMGGNRFVEQCEGYDVYISTGLAFKTVKAYKQEYKEVPKYWTALENTVKKLFKQNIKGKWVDCGFVSYRREKNYVMCRLPSGAILYYHGMRLRKDDELMYYTTPKQGGKRMIPRKIWGGGLLEHICQATGRELMATAMLKLEAHDFKNQLTVHDELINRIVKEEHHREVQQIILDIPSWASTLPIDIEGEAIDRYRKV